LIDIEEPKADYKKAARGKIIKQLRRWHQLLLVQTPEVKPFITHFEPWFPFDGLMGVLLSLLISTGELKAFYSGKYG
jgi:hypothetical protein